MFRLRCIPHASKIREKRALRASVDSDRHRQRRNRQSGTDTSISGIFNSIPARRNFRDICLLRRRFSLSLFLYLSLLKYAGASTLFFTRPFFPFIRHRFQPRVPVVWTTTRILFRRLHAIFPAEKCSLWFPSRSPPIGTFSQNIYVYIQSRPNGVSKLFSERYSRADVFIWRFSALRFFSPIIFSPIN